MSMYVTAAVVTIIGVGVSAYSSYESAKTQEEIGEYNNKVASDAANNEAEVAAENARRQRDENRRKLAMVRSKLAGNGVNIGQGSALDVLGESAGELELQALDVFRDSDARQRQLQSQAQMSLYQGQQAGAAGTTGAIGTLLSGTGSALKSSTTRTGTV